MVVKHKAILRLYPGNIRKYAKCQLYGNTFVFRDFQDITGEDVFAITVNAIGVHTGKKNPASISFTFESFTKHSVNNILAVFVSIFLSCLPDIKVIRKKEKVAEPSVTKLVSIFNIPDADPRIVNSPACANHMLIRFT